MPGKGESEEIVGRLRVRAGQKKYRLTIHAEREREADQIT